MKMSKAKEFSILCLASFSVVIGCFIFCRGFLLNRLVFTDKSMPCYPLVAPDDLRQDFSESSPRPCHGPIFSKTILVLVDALRYDFIHRMSFLSSIVQQGEEDLENRMGGHGILGISSCAFKFIADPPTTTMQRLKALMSGTMPTFIDASANFNRFLIDTSMILQLLCSSIMDSIPVMKWRRTT